MAHIVSPLRADEENACVVSLDPDVNEEIYTSINLLKTPSQSYKEPSEVWDGKEEETDQQKSVHEIDLKAQISFITLLVYYVKHNIFMGMEFAKMIGSFIKSSLASFRQAKFERFETIDVHQDINREENDIRNNLLKTRSQSYKEPSEVPDEKKEETDQQKSVHEIDLKAQGKNEYGVRMREDTSRAGDVNKPVEIRNIHEVSDSPYEKQDNSKISTGANDLDAKFLEPKPAVYPREESLPVSFNKTKPYLNICMVSFGVILALSLAGFSVAYTLRSSTQYNINSGTELYLVCHGELVVDLSRECRRNHQCPGTLGSFSTNKTGTCSIQIPSAGGLSLVLGQLTITNHGLGLKDLGSGAVAINKIKESSADGPRSVINVTFSPDMSALQMDNHLLDRLRVMVHNLQINVQCHNDANESYSCSSPAGWQNAKVCEPLSRLSDSQGYLVSDVKAADLVKNPGKYIFNGLSPSGIFNVRLFDLKVNMFNESSLCFSFVDQSKMSVWRSCSNYDTFVNNLSSDTGMSSVTTIDDNGMITFNITNSPDFIILYSVKISNSQHVYFIAEFKHPLTSINNSHDDKKAISRSSIIIMIVFLVLALVLAVVGFILRKRLIDFVTNRWIFFFGFFGFLSHNYDVVMAPTGDLLGMI